MRHSGTRIHLEHGFAGVLLAVASATRPDTTVAAPLAWQPACPSLSHLAKSNSPRRGRRPAWQPTRDFGLRFRTQVGEDLLDDLGILDTGDGSHRTTTGPAGFVIAIERPFQALSYRFIDGLHLAIDCSCFVTGPFISSF